MADDEVGVVGSAGDSFLIAFASAVDAVACAIVWQSACAEAAEAQPAGQRMLFRIGIHLGDVIPEGGTIYADGVNIAARLEKLAQPLPFSNMSGEGAGVFQRRHYRGHHHGAQPVSSRARSGETSIGRTARVRPAILQPRATRRSTIAAQHVVLF